MKAAIRILLAGCASGIFASTALCNYLLVKENKIQQEQICSLYANELLHGSVDYRVMDPVSKVCQPYFEEKSKEEHKQTNLSK